ncbi:MAG: hypothetical protein A2X13_04110 [Bacteroidetes bacterium GWC2_33_15]|nr:MAG: hypothetical protein A2X10_00875 [Bacteroidetes bacterium GWA2_33_15]OFX49705.1 MAG: hypothetical protein A2X13_04110 [Bacteroidetes bacterium GWC2_33_15]OFX65905.1 MAG: hypothetical protein A2X15_10725 [Bacteroidetes bacterium GWB2_32_14]OFX68334.1 MAG: hypothetical protein A2X14_08170 [Bacteroidetes bacterium GWD2_33_33]HAN18121.1 hypothetical protein [Bacteroidales bacterium]
MKLKTLIFKIILIFFLGLIPIGVYANNRDSTFSFKATLLLPDYVKLQYAGGIGFISPGLGYTFLKHRLDITLFYGYIPSFLSSDDLHSISLQFTGKIFKFSLKKDIDVLPLNIGFFLHHNFGEEYWVTLPSHYPENYYWWSPGRMGGIFIGGEIRTKLLAHYTPASGLAFYFRVGSRGLYLTSAWDNSEIQFTDILELGFGIALYR